MDKKTVIITGAGQGIGRATAEFLLNHEYAVSLWENDPDALADAQTKLAPHADAQFIHCDVSDERSVKKAISDTQKHFGRIDALINNAAVMQEKSLDELSFAEWNETIGVNLSGMFLCAKYAVPHLRNGGAPSSVSAPRGRFSLSQTPSVIQPRRGAFSPSRTRWP